ncbi:MAG: hypothetical protein ABFR32_09825 [Bacteroidota bacterium]
MNKKVSNNSQYNTILLFFGLMILSISFSFAQKNKDLIQDVEVNIQSKILGERRVISIHLPDNYNFTSYKYTVN